MRKDESARHDKTPRYASGPHDGLRVVGRHGSVPPLELSMKKIVPSTTRKAVKLTKATLKKLTIKSGVRAGDQERKTWWE
jgi:hypothetical protein